MKCASFRAGATLQVCWRNITSNWYLKVTSDLAETPFISVPVIARAGLAEQRRGRQVSKWDFNTINFNDAAALANPKRAMLVGVGIIAACGAAYWYSDVIFNYGSADADCIKFAEETGMNPASRTSGSRATKSWLNSDRKLSMKASEAIPISSVRYRWRPDQPAEYVRAVAIQVGPQRIDETPRYIVSARACSKADL
ncbi:hypothetical protein [Bradyrhizobium sp. Tv2a-2]|uniref:hypothetical protein n=1 Tax=Bradyrhizobium sp. Tv2a-2 TaxID=113395 RepID=UPI0012EB8C56|nr:hypothetical protein [Bradyrhizobium sp. Tv2a-2]